MTVSKRHIEKRSLIAASENCKNFRSLRPEVVSFRNTSVPRWRDLRKAPLEILDRDLAGEAVVGAVKADQPGYDPLKQRRTLGEDGLQDGLLALE
jgi:hypothetical protein